MLRTPQRRGMLSSRLLLSHARYAGALAVSRRAVALSARVPGTAAALWPCLQTRSTAAIARTEIDPIYASGAFLAFKFATTITFLPKISSACMNGTNPEQIVLGPSGSLKSISSTYSLSASGCTSHLVTLPTLKSIISLVVRSSSVAAA